MWIVRLALRRPYTFAVFALLLLILGPISILNTPTDIFPNIDIPVVSIVWQYQGLSPEQMAQRIVYQTERTLTTTVNNIEHIESQSLDGVGVVKIFFQPQVNIAMAVAQVTAIAQTQLRQLPQGTTPPLVIQYSASSVPILQLGLSGEGLSEQQLNDYGLNFIRTQLATVEGAASPFPYGGKQRQVQVDLDLQALQAQGLSPTDVVNAIGVAESDPAFRHRQGRHSSSISSPPTALPTTSRSLNDLPIKTRQWAIVYIHDVAHVRDGFPPQTNIVRVDGQRASLMSGAQERQCLDAGHHFQVSGACCRSCPVAASATAHHPLVGSIDFRARRHRRRGARGHHRWLPHRHHDPGLPRQLAQHPDHCRLHSLLHPCFADRAGRPGRDHQHHDLGRPGAGRRHPGRRRDGRNRKYQSQSRRGQRGGAGHSGWRRADRHPGLCLDPLHLHRLCAHVFLGGVAKYLFVPLAEAVVFAMLASYFLSRTVVPTMAKYLLQEHDDDETEKQKQQSRNPLGSCPAWLSSNRFEQLAPLSIRGLLQLAIEHSAVFLILFFVVYRSALLSLLYPWLGQDFFPSVDAGAVQAAPARPHRHPH